MNYDARARGALLRSGEQARTAAPGEITLIDGGGPTFRIKKAMDSGVILNAIFLVIIKDGVIENFEGVGLGQVCRQSFSASYS